MGTYAQIEATQKLWVTQLNPPSVFFAYHLGTAYFVVEDYRSIIRVISTDGKGVVYTVNSSKVVKNSNKWQYSSPIGMQIAPIYEISDGALIRISCAQGAITSADKFVKDEIRKIWYG